VSLKPLSEKDYSRLEKQQLSWRKLSADNSLLDLRFQGKALTEETIAVLADYASYITWLNLSEANVQNSALEAIAKMENLTRLYLQKNDLSDTNLDLLGSLDHLEILNLHSTQVDQQIFDIAKQLPALKKLYLWNTAVSSNQIMSQQALFPDTDLVGGLE
jgi:Leucine-rich repeat (LRR) protein